MSKITASQLKTEGIAAIEKCLAVDCEAVITVRGEEKFVVMYMQRYNYLREREHNNKSQCKKITREAEWLWRMYFRVVIADEIKEV